MCTAGVFTGKRRPSPTIEGGKACVVDFLLSFKYRYAYHDRPRGHPRRTGSTRMTGRVEC